MALKNIKIWGKRFTIDHSISEGEKRTTIYDIINRFESGKNAKLQSEGGRLADIFNKQTKKKLKRLVRPIEDFWSLLKARVYENNWEA